MALLLTMVQLLTQLLNLVPAVDTKGGNKIEYDYEEKVRTTVLDVQSYGDKKGRDKVDTAFRSRAAVEYIGAGKRDDHAWRAGKRELALQ